MVISCLLCKKAYGSEGRALHRFPRQEHFLNKWLEVLGLEKGSLKEHHRVCSEHFSKDDYNFKSGRLKSNAYPRYNLIMRDRAISPEPVPWAIPCQPDDPLSNLSALPKTYDYQKFLNKESSLSGIPTKVVTKDGNIMTVYVPYTEQKNTDVVQEEEKEEIHTVEQEFYAVDLPCDDNFESMVCEPEEVETKFDILDVTPENKKDRVISLNGLKKTDFTSEGAWELYRKNYFRLKKQIKDTKKKIVKIKSEKKLNSINVKLKKKHPSDQEQFLKEIPDVLREILLHCKADKNGSKIYSTELKNFSKNLHGYSEAAYNFVRSQFGNSLPSSNTVERWKLKDDKSKELEELREM